MKRYIKNSTGDPEEFMNILENQIDYLEDKKSDIYDSEDIHSDGDYEDDDYDEQLLIQQLY